MLSSLRLKGTITVLYFKDSTGDSRRQQPASSFENRIRPFRRLFVRRKYSIGIGPDQASQRKHIYNAATALRQLLSCLCMEDRPRRVYRVERLREESTVFEWEVFIIRMRVRRNSVAS